MVNTVVDTILKKILMVPTNVNKPLDTPTVEPVVAIKDLYDVRWSGRIGEYSGDLVPQIEVLTSKKDAERFAQALRDAFKLLRHTGEGTSVVVRKREQK